MELNYYSIAPLGRNLPALIYQSKHIFHKNDIVAITINKKPLLGVVIESTQKPSFQCEEAIKSDCVFSENQLILGHFIANYYCVNVGVALGIFTPKSADFCVDSVDSAKGDSKKNDFAKDDSVDSKKCDSMDSADSTKANFADSTKDSKVDSTNCINLDSTQKINITLPTLNKSQQNALNFILSHPKTLLFGDTGSGKTEIYINAINHTINENKSILFLMPEIALTPQMEQRLKSVFGDLVCIWHSKVSKKKKSEILKHLDSMKIIAGARSALFLPLKNLGLIIIDEEHDDAYKSTQTPRYNARDLAIILAKKQNIRLILGSATPSVNSYYHFKKDNSIFRLKGGYFDGKKTIIFDRNDEILSPYLHSKIDTILKNHKQSIIFVPMRGNFKVLQCNECGSGVKCKNCTINMSLHSKRNALICHYCGYSEAFFFNKTQCKICNAMDFKAYKVGTQEVYKQISLQFPNAKIAIFDRDEVTSDTKLRKILSDFNDGKIDILIGTQMISKGHDYHNVELVAILGIDILLNGSDFRAYERAVSLLIQIAGRCGRKNNGEVIIATKNERFFEKFLNDYEDFLNFELENRVNLYPPFTRIALLIAQNKDEKKALEILQNAKKIVESTQKSIEIVGLNKAPIERINGLWRYFLLLRANNAKILLPPLHLCKNEPLIIDIDPQQIF